MREKLFAKTLFLSDVNPEMENRFLELFQTCYEGVDKENFKMDLYRKEKVIVLYDRKNQIQGFSTIKTFCLEVENKKYYFLFSGDTVIHPDFWGTSALTMEFLRNIIKEKCKHPFAPVYWYLMTKGYKTYLLLANNFVNYYPCYDKKTPLLIEKLLKASSDYLYPGIYDSTSGLLVFEKHETLKDSIAPIGEKQLAYPKIKFFSEINPHWSKGEELACLGEIEFKLLVVHPWKVFKKRICKLLNIKYQANKPDKLKI